MDNKLNYCLFKHPDQTKNSRVLKEKKDSGNIYNRDYSDQRLTYPQILAPLYVLNIRS